MYLDISSLHLFKTCVPLAGIFPLSIVLSQFQHDIQFTWPDSKVMKLIFSWLYWQYCSPLTQTAIDRDPSSIPICSGMALQWLIVE